MTQVIRNINKCGNVIKQIVTSNDRGPKGDTGAKGEQGVSVEGVAISGDKLITTLSNGEEINAGKLPIAKPQYIDLAYMDGTIRQFDISPAIDPNDLSYIMINGVVYTAGWIIDNTGSTLTIELDEIPTGLLQLVINANGLIGGNGGGGSVISVNGKMGAVVLNAQDVGALPIDTPIPTRTSEITNDSGFQNNLQVDTKIANAISQIDIPTKVSQLANDKNYQTDTQVNATVENAISGLEIPTKTSDLENDSQFQSASQVASSIATAKAAVEAEIPRSVSELINDENYQTDTEVSSSISTAVTPLQSSINSLDNSINKTVLDDATVASNASTTTIKLEKVNIKDGSTAIINREMPVANATTSGIMNSSTYQGFLDLADTAEAILESAVAINNLPSSPTQGELTIAWKEATGKTTLINNASIFDSTNEKQWTYFVNDSTWHYVTAGGGTVEVRQWTNAYAGIVKGSTEDGQIFAEIDGTGSVNGWDEVKTDIQNLENAGYQTATDVANTIASTNVFDLADGSDYATTASVTAGLATKQNKFIRLQEIEDPNDVINVETLENGAYVCNKDCTLINNLSAQIPVEQGAIFVKNDASIGLIYGYGLCYCPFELNDWNDVYAPTFEDMYSMPLTKNFPDLTTIDKTIIDGINEVNSIAKGANQVWTGTQAEFDALTTYKDNTDYRII